MGSGVTELFEKLAKTKDYIPEKQYKYTHTYIYTYKVLGFLGYTGPHVKSCPGASSSIRSPPGGRMWSAKRLKPSDPIVPDLPTSPQILLFFLPTGEGTHFPQAGLKFPPSSVAHIEFRMAEFKDLLLSTNISYSHTIIIISAISWSIIPTIFLIFNN